MKDTDKETLDLAYDMIVPAYNWSLGRISAVERRIDRLIALIVIVTVAFPIAVMAIGGDEPMSTSGLSITLASCALALAAFSVGSLMYTRQMGRVQYTLPRALNQEEWLSASPAEFRQGILEQAGSAIEANRELANTRTYYTDWMMGVFGMEALIGLAWAAVQLTG